MNLTLLSFVTTLAFASTAEPREITDMAGRSVTVPDEILSVVTIGAVPVLNTYVFAAGQGDKLAMALLWIGVE